MTRKGHDYVGTRKDSWEGTTLKGRTTLGKRRVGDLCSPRTSVADPETRQQAVQPAAICSSRFPGV